MRPLKTFGLSIAACLSLTLGICEAQTVLTRHVRQATQDGTARFIGNLSSTQNLRLVITLRLQNQDELNQLIKNLYDPTSLSYHQFLTVAQFTEEFGPTQAQYDALVNFAQANGLTVVDTSPNRVNLQVTGSVASIQSAFHVNLGVYQHPTENRIFYAPDREPTTNLTFSLWHVSGLDNFSIPKPAGLKQIPAGPSSKSDATTGSGPSASFLGSDMRAAYYSAEGGTLTGSGQTLGLLEYYGTDLADLQTYYKNAGQTYPGSASSTCTSGATCTSGVITLLSADGTSTYCLDSKVGGDCDDTEQTLDMTQALGMAPALAGLTMYVGSTDAAIFNSMATHSPLPSQLSSSWNWSPADPSTDYPYFEEFAAQGQNLFQAAGDSSAWTLSSEIYPADDVYLTSVGGTDLSTAAAAGAWASETAWADGGGGISPDKFAIPSWQVTAAASCSSCSQSYRNGPDVSANANFTYYVCADQTTCTANVYGGTSFAAPLWAGYLALVNQQRATNGNGPLGFVNPSLYLIGDAGGTTYSTAFHDITSGSNGYSATTGYDLVTGWGSPNGTGLFNALSGPVASLSSALSFPNTPAGTTSAALAATLSNTGTAVLNNIVPSIVGTNPSDFALTTGTNACGSTLAAGSSCSIYVTFTPASAASFSATLSVADSAPGSPQTVSLSGTGTAATSSTGQYIFGSQADIAVPTAAQSWTGLMPIQSNLWQNNATTETRTR